ncbi:hypothetical protein BLNAU_23475 [Blattamonas nauphoetae]|uniref:Uncharacterized protein n=1 Tax=Blattamonas nauphoetae TaxID=2049346 RepID=A0ABQ9WQI4_9EUKA|nr:hypothetical protein BLNAU_23475 [Blattamonas nauphoetae]
MLGRPKCLHSFVETDHLSGGGGEGKDDTPNTQKSATPRSLPLNSPAYRIFSTLGSKIPSEHEFHAKSTQMFIESRPTVERLKSPSLHPLLLPLLPIGDSREDNDHVIDQTESTLPPSLQLDNELKEESTLLSGTYVPTHSRSPVVLALILPSSLKTVSIGEVIDEVNKETLTNMVFSTPRSVPTTRSARSQPVSPVSPEHSKFLFDSEE